MSTNPNSHLPDMIEQERRDGPQPDDSPTVRVRRLVLSGEPFTYKSIAAEVGASEALASMALRNLRSIGFQFEQERFQQGEHDDGRPIYAQRYTCTNPGLSLSSMQRHGKKHRARAQNMTDDTSTAVAVLDATRPPRPEQEQLVLDDERLPLPAVDTQLTVYLAMRERDGTTRLGLRNGSQSWLLTVDAHAVEAGEP